MQRIRLTISYDGTAYHGWQRQIDEPVTVEETIEQALSGLLNEDVDIQGASRTDAGVHALGQVAHFDTESTIPAERYAIALNGRLPKDIRIVESTIAAPDFHARFNAKAKRYRYTIFTGLVSDPLRRNSEHYLPERLDIDAMNEASVHIVGKHDFSCFEKESDPERDSTREVFTLEVSRDGDRVHIEVEGSGFLYNMVRAIAGTLIKVGRGKRLPGWVKEVVTTCNRLAAGPTLPANGLVLLEVKY